METCDRCGRPSMVESCEICHKSMCEQCAAYSEVGGYFTGRCKECEDTIKDEERELEAYDEWNPHGFNENGQPRTEVDAQRQKDYDALMRFYEWRLESAK